MKAKAVIPLVLGLCIGLIAVKFGIDAIRSAKASNAAKETIMALKATQDIDIGTEITLEMIQAVETVPNDFVPAMERIEKVEDVVGRVAEKYIPQNAAVLRSMLSPEGTSAGLVGQIPQGFRAISVKIDEVTSVAYQIKPGDWVDVGVVMDIQGSRGREKNTIAEVILQRVQVAAVGRSITTGPAAKEGGSKGTAAKSVTLLVKEEDVPKLQLANTRGSVTLAMRGDDPNTMAKTPSASINEILGGGSENAAAPNPAMSGTAMMEMIAQAVQAQAAATAAANPQTPVAAKTPPPPHQVLVYNGRSGAPGLMVEQYTFENRQSRKLLGITGGPGASSALMAGARPMSTSPTDENMTPAMPSAGPGSGTPGTPQTPLTGAMTPGDPSLPYYPQPAPDYNSMANTIMSDFASQMQNVNLGDLLFDSDDESEAE